MKHRSMNLALCLGMLICICCACGQSAEISESQTDSVFESNSIFDVQITALTEEKILLDIQDNDDFFLNYNLTIDTQSITERLTDLDTGMDKVYCLIEASNAEFSYHAEYEMTYIASDRTWTLEQFEKTANEYHALTGMPQEIADSVVAAEYERPVYISDERTDNQHIFCYTASVMTGPINACYDITLSYVFEPGGWILSDKSIVEAASTATSIELMENLLNRVWDDSVQLAQYLCFFPDGTGMLLGTYGIERWESSPFTYMIIENTVQITYADWENIWIWNPEHASFYYEFDETITGKAVMTVSSLSVSQFFSDLAAIDIKEIHSDSYLISVMEQLLLYYNGALTAEEYGTIEQSQADWQSNLDQQIAEQGVDITTTRGCEWRSYYIRNRIYELLGLPLDTSDPPVYNLNLTLEEAREIAEHYWGQKTSYDYIEEQTGETLYYFTFVSTDIGLLGRIAVDKITGECNAIPVRGIPLS